MDQDGPELGKHFARHGLCRHRSIIIPFLTEGQLRFFLLSNRVIQWISSVIVLGITSYFINTGPRGLTIVYLEVVVRMASTHQ